MTHTPFWDDPRELRQFLSFVIAEAVMDDEDELLDLLERPWEYRELYQRFRSSDDYDTYDLRHA